MNMILKPVTISSIEVMNDKVINSQNEQIVGTAPFEYINTDSNGIDNYKVLEDQIYIILPNGVKKLLDISGDTFTLT